MKGKVVGCKREGEWGTKEILIPAMAPSRTCNFYSNYFTCNSITQVKTSGLGHVKLCGKDPLQTTMCEGVFFSANLSFGPVFALR